MEISIGMDMRSST